VPPRLSLFVHRASQYLTDRGSHGDGLICFSLLNGLAERGHRVHAFADNADIGRCSPNLTVLARRHRVPANALGPWEQSLRAERWLRRLRDGGAPIDLVWRMHPYNGGCPYPPYTAGRPLVVGPLFYGWPEETVPEAIRRAGRPRFGVGVGPLVEPLANRGWKRALRRASLIICATRPHAAAVRAEVPGVPVVDLPVIVDPPAPRDPRPRPAAATGRGRPLTLAFVGNLVANKRADVFVETVRLLRTAGFDARGLVAGDGPERPALTAACRAAGVADAVTFLGRVPNDQVFDVVRTADVFVSTSLGEPYGRAIAEAMAAGTPCACHASGGPADFVRDGVDGLLVPAVTAAAYAAAIAGAATADGGAALGRMSAAAARAAEAWRPGPVLDALQGHLAEVVARARRRRATAVTG